MYQAYQILQERKAISEIKIEELRNRLSKLDILTAQNNLCIYAVGSIRRLEACDYSDLDIFFINRGESPISKLDQTLIFAGIIEICRELKFPEFSNDGEFIKIHNFSEIKLNLGNPSDDYHNHFSARILLLLESTYLFNKEVWEDVVTSTIDIYFKDFHDHEKNFKPIFLVNDIIRFWRSMTLLYENRRNRTFEEINDEQLKTKKKHETHLKNFKLKFSRKLICGSFLVKLMENIDKIDKVELLKIVKMSPLERIYSIDNHNLNIKNCKERVMDNYIWFLDLTNKPKEDLVNYMADINQRNFAFEQSRTFHKNLGRLILALGEGNQDLLIYLLL